MDGTVFRHAELQHRGEYHSCRSTMPCTPYWPIYRVVLFHILSFQGLQAVQPALEFRHIILVGIPLDDIGQLSRLLSLLVGGELAWLGDAAEAEGAVEEASQDVFVGFVAS